MKLLVSACLLGAHCRYDGEAVADEGLMALLRGHEAVPFCPEIYGGLPTPREKAEILDGRVRTQSGRDVTDAYERGARDALALVCALGCTHAILKDRSPSCGVGVIHDGRFSGGLTAGDGVTAALLRAGGVEVCAASEARRLLCPCTKAGCERHGDCDACRARHEEGRRPPYCERKRR